MNKLNINNFKCFQDCDIEINNLTVLAGANGYGKSSVIQTLLFMRHTIEKVCNFDKQQQQFIENPNNLCTEINLNDSYDLSLGYSSSIINREIQKSEVRFQISDEENDLDFHLSYYIDASEDKLWVQFNEIFIKKAAEFSILKKEFYYLNAERIGPRVSHTLHHTPFLNTGYKGELTAQVINFNNGREKVNSDRIFPGSKNENLEAQVNNWLDFIIPGVRVTAKTDTQTLTSRILIENQLTKNDPIIATNIGFGISYILPVIVTGLIAKPNTFFIVENPEAHLHPSAQSKIGIFLAMVANSGVKVIVETHSDHVINGIQIAVASNTEFKEKTTVNYFSLDDDTNQPLIKAIKILEKGQLSDWPKGFLDQAQQDYSYLLKLRSGNV
jgi:predicted ATPase